MDKLAVLTSGGDAPGMNAAVRSVVRTALYWGKEIYGIYRGYAGLLEDDMISMNSSSVSGIVLHGGTMLKTARCKAFLKRKTRKRRRRSSGNGASEDSSSSAATGPSRERKSCPAWAYLRLPCRGPLITTCTAPMKP